MDNMPKVKPGSWIRLAEEKVSAVVCTVYEGLSADGGHIEVVYLDNVRQAINEDVKWNGSDWEFAKSGQVGGDADNYRRLDEFVNILRAGHRRQK